MSSIDAAEIANFSRLANQWWDPEGALRPLHKMNPARLEYIREIVCVHFHRKSGKSDAFKRLHILDIGCGGGLLCEPLARLGARVTGLDAGAEAIKNAKAHAALSGLAITYHHGSAEEFACGKKKFDVITMLEIVEHVADIGSLLDSAQKMLKPGGVLILSTLNRSLKSFLLGVVAAEYMLRWVPKGTHDWRKFLRPSELAGHLNDAGLDATDITGVVFDPLNDSFRLKKTAVDVNYMMTAIKKQASSSPAR